MSINYPSTFVPPVAAVPLGAAGTVLTSNGVNVKPTFEAVSGGGGSLPGRIAFNVASGITNNLNPGGTWPTSIARLLANPTAGNAELTGLIAGTDGQLVLLWNAAAIGGNTIQLDNLAAGSTAANRFTLSDASMILPPQSGAWLVYDGTLSLWLTV